MASSEKTLMTSGIDNAIFDSYDIEEQPVEETQVLPVEKEYVESPEKAEFENAIANLSTEEIEAYFLATRESAVETARKSMRFFKFSVGLAACRNNFESLRKLDRALTAIPPLQKAIRASVKIATDGFITISAKGIIKAPIGEQAVKMAKAAYLQWQAGKVNPIDSKRMNDYRKEHCHQLNAKKATAKANKTNEENAKLEGLLTDLRVAGFDEDHIHTILIAVKRYTG